jgi:hypothetical protein
MPVFDVQTHIDFYNMLVDDFDDFMLEQHSARRAFHCVLEIYHLREWIWHDSIEHNEALKDALKGAKRRAHAFATIQLLK